MNNFLLKKSDNLQQNVHNHKLIQVGVAFAPNYWSNKADFYSYVSLFDSLGILFHFNIPS